MEITLRSTRVTLAALSATVKLSATGVQIKARFLTFGILSVEAPKLMINVPWQRLHPHDLCREDFRGHGRQLARFLFAHVCRSLPFQHPFTPKQRYNVDMRGQFTCRDHTEDTVWHKSPSELSQKRFSLRTRIHSRPFDDSGRLRSVHEFASNSLPRLSCPKVRRHHSLASLEPATVRGHCSS
jgi:hypothetical protein